MTDDRVHSSSRPIVKEMAENAAPVSVTPDQRRPILPAASTSAPPVTSAGPLAVPETRTAKNAGARPPTELLALANLMESWAAALPGWDSQVTEPWFVYLERAYEAETSLAKRLRRLPTCRLSMCPLRMKVSLRLADISVSTKQGLAAACRAWARNARAGGNS